MCEGQECVKGRDADRPGVVQVHKTGMCAGQGEIDKKGGATTRTRKREKDCAFGMVKVQGRDAYRAGVLYMAGGGGGGRRRRREEGGKVRTRRRMTET
jgi:hypothetical protein